MTAKCANPTCSVPFYRLGRGKLFRFEVRSVSEPCRDVPDNVCRTKSGRGSVYFWLCGKCRLTKTVRFDPASGLTIGSILGDTDYAPVPKCVETQRNDEQGVTGAL